MKKSDWSFQVSIHFTLTTKARDCSEQQFLFREKLSLAIKLNITCGLTSGTPERLISVNICSVEGNSVAFSDVNGILVIKVK